MSTVDADPLAAAAEPRRPGRRMTEEQFVAWAARTERRAEWVDGEVELMNAVELNHDRFTQFLHRFLGSFVEVYKLGEVFSGSYQVRLRPQRRRRGPDLFYLEAARAHLLERMQCSGPPNLIVEVISPDSRTRDRRTKFAEYEAAGVPEYWLPDPPLRTFEAYALGADGRYARLPERDGRVYSSVLTGVYFRPDWVWQLRPPDAMPLLAEMCAERARLLGSSPPSPPSDKPSG